MDFNKTIAALNELQEYCKNNDTCDGCKFFIAGLCVFYEAMPESWLLPVAEKEGDTNDL